MNRLVSVLFGALALLVTVSPLTAQDQQVLENGLIRVTFDQHTGRFQAMPLAGGLQVHNAGVAFQVNGTKVVAGQASRVTVMRERFHDPIGEGQRLVVQYTFTAGVPNVRYELGLYSGKPWLSATAYFPPGDYALGDLSVVEGKIRAASAFRARVYVNSGTTGGNSGVWDLGIKAWSSANLSAWYEPNLEDALCAGFYSFYRASSSVDSQYLAPDEIGMSAVAHYNGYKPQGGELRSESLLLNFGRDPVAMLEQWADAAVKVVHPRFIADTQTSLDSTWYIYGDKITEADTLEQARLLKNSILYGYGIKLFGLGEWQLQRFEPGDLADHFGFGEDQVDRKVLPHELKWLSEQLEQLGFVTAFGANYAYAAPQSTLAKRKVSWVMFNDLSRPDCGYPIDYTDPDAQKWLYDIAHQTTDYKSVVWWDDFDGGPHRGPLHDPTKVMGFEDIREGLKTIRRAIGPDVSMDHFCCGPFFTYVGLADRVRVGEDTRALGDFEGFKAMARQLSTNFMLHQRFWINDPDPVFVGGRDMVHDPGTGPLPPDAADLAEVRMRLQHEVATGSYISLGETPADWDSERLHLLTLALPSYGQAARPLDLFINTPAEVYDLNVKASWDSWHVVMLQNWNNSRKSYDIDFAQLGIPTGRTCLVYRFWDQTFLGEYRRQLSLSAGAREGETYLIREAPAHPWVLSTDMHLTQGGVDLPEVNWDATGCQLTGKAARHAGAEGRVVVYAPEGYHLSSASAPYLVEKQPSGAELIRLDLKFQSATLPWSVSFSALR
jgi:hypothetical protein